MTTPDLHQLWQQTLSDWQASGLSGAAYCKQGAGLTVSLPGGVSITGLHAGNIELLGAVLRQL